MTRRFTPLTGRWLGLLLLLVSWGARAQSGPYGNEWIVPGQAYYKLKVTQAGLYRLDQAYLAAAGVPATTNPQRVQLWRRGREVALYGGGNQQQLDASTYFEFYGQRNDGQLDRGMYKQATDQPHQLYSLFTDTAAYFLTVSPTTNGRRMSELVTTPGTVHPTWLQNRLRLMVHPEVVPYGIRFDDPGENREYYYGKAANSGVTYLPWADKNEGFSTNDISTSFTFVMDSLHRRSGAQTWLEILLIGAYTTNNQHSTTLSVLPGGTGAARQLTTVTYPAFSSRRVRVPLLRSDIGPDGKVGIQTSVTNPNTPSTDRLRIGYIRVVSSQATRWVSGRRQLDFWNDSTQAGAAYYQLDSIPASVIGYDVTDPVSVVRTAGVALSGQQRGYGFGQAVGRTRQLLLFDAARPFTPLPAQRLTFSSINPNAGDFLIVTSKALMKPVGTVPDVVQAYANYRRTGGPGRLPYDVTIVTSEQLYDQFHYGERSPLAVRHYAQYMLSTGRTGLHLLLLGKGVFNTEDLGSPVQMFRQATPSLRALTADLVPVSTRGQSDIFFTADWPNDNYVPQMLTGRVPAYTPQQVLNYLNKLRDHEIPGPALWRKNILHLAGGKDAPEQQRFQGYLNDCAAIARRPLLGANVTTMVNTGNGGGSANIVPAVNAGVALITYFGHGSGTVIDLQPPPITQLSSGYAQGGKYPVFLAGGCSIGRSAAAPYNSLNEDWLLAENRGAIGWMADSDLDTEYGQKEYLKLLYQLLLHDPAWYGKPATAAQAEALRRLQTMPTYASILNSVEGQAMMMNFTWHGDPAVSLMSPALPDYLFTPGVTAVAVESVDNRPVLASTTNFNLRLRLSNHGKVEPVRNLRITVTRTDARGLPIPVPPIRIQYFLKDTTVLVPVTNSSAAAVFGSNAFTVRLDDPNSIPELSETNNSASITYSFLNGGITLLNPSPYAIVGRADVRLVGQSNLPAPGPLQYEFELDTIPSFATARRATITALDVATWTPTLAPRPAGRDSVVYYWRMRFAPAPDRDTSWVRSSFRFINNSPGGWSQSHYGQLASATKTTVAQQAPSGRWDFTPISVPLQLQTVGSNNPNSSRNPTFRDTYGISVNGQLVSANRCGRTDLVTNYVSTDNIVAAVFDPVTIRQLDNVPGGPYRMCGQPGQPFYHFSSTYNNSDSLNAYSVNYPPQQVALLRFLQNVPNGAYVALVSVNRVNFPAFLPALKAELAAMGSTLITTAQDGDPLVMLLRKGFPSQAREATFVPTDPTPRYEQVITFNTTLTGRNTTGAVTSTRIGPAQRWEHLYHTIKRPDGVAADRYTLRVVGYDASNQRQVLLQNVTLTDQDLTSINARDYPYLQLELDLHDTINRTPPQLKQWLVTYQGLPEGVARRDHPSIPSGAYDRATLSAAAASTGILNIPLYFENVAPVAFSGPTQAKAIITETRSGGRVQTVTIPASRVPGFSLLPGADSTAVYNFRLDVTRVQGDATIRLVANSQELPEQVFFNNELNLSFTAPTITTPPLLDVAFDGIHILNGDIVSPTPEVVVDVKYEDKRLPITDPSKVELLLTHLGDRTTQVVPMTNNPAISFDTDAGAGRFRVYYTPAKRMNGEVQPLADGVYKLEVQAQDMTGNQAGAQRYGIQFEVVNQSSITNVLPYPNPVTSRARFVFTLTGQQLPRNMKIQILTVTGKVVREILQSELGPLRIGNNITEYAWDGTDQYGDRLANGTYLYRVVLDDAESQFEHRRTSADQFFKKGWGKLVLLR